MSMTRLWLALLTYMTLALLTYMTCVHSSHTIPQQSASLPVQGRSPLSPRTPEGNIISDIKKQLGPLEESNICNFKSCDVDCQIGPWVKGSCGATGGVSTRTFTRKPLRLPQGAGVPCGDTAKQEECKMGACACHLSLVALLKLSFGYFGIAIFIGYALTIFARKRLFKRPKKVYKAARRRRKLAFDPYAWINRVPAIAQVLPLPSELVLTVDEYADSKEEAEYRQIVRTKDHKEQGYLLHRAVQAGDIVRVETLLRIGAKVDVQNANRFTPLHEAAARDQRSIAALLLEAKADANSRDKFEKTPLHRSVHFGHSAASVLLKAKADPNARDADRCTPLHYAAMKGRGRATVLLLNAGADINPRSSCLHTPLHRAVANHHVPTVTVLLEARADVNARDIFGNTPLSLAAGRPMILSLLRRAPQ